MLDRLAIRAGATLLAVATAAGVSVLLGIWVPVIAVSCAVALAHAEAERAHELAAEGVLPTGALALVRDDPYLIGYFYLKSARTAEVEQLFKQDHHWAAPVLWRSAGRKSRTTCIEISAPCQHIAGPPKKALSGLGGHIRHSGGTAES